MPPALQEWQCPTMSGIMTGADAWRGRWGKAARWRTWPVVAAIVIYLSWTTRPERRPLLLWLFGWVILTWLIVVAVHEGGHWIACRVVGFRVTGLRIGPMVVTWPPRRIQWRLSADLF